MAPANNLVRPVISDGEYSYERVNVEAQRRDPNSLLNRIERMIRLRKEHPEFGMGEWSVIDTGEPAIFAIRAAWTTGVMVAVHNFSGSPCKVRLKLPDKEAQHLVDTLKGETFMVPKDGVSEIQLDGYGFRWLRVAAGLQR